MGTAVRGGAMACGEIASMHWAKLAESIARVLGTDNPAYQAARTAGPGRGRPPGWYKAPPYRSRAVIEPRAVLKDFGVEIGEDVEVRVWDSSAEVRYMVLPRRPKGTEGSSEAELAKLVSRDGMIGTAP